MTSLLDRRTEREWLEVRHAARVRTYADDPEKVETILRDRAASLASRGRQEIASADLTRVVEFWLRDERYGVPLSALAGFVVVGELANVPGAPQELAGITYARGEIWSVYNLGKLLGLATGEPSGAAPVLLLRHGRGLRVGLMADRLHGLRDLDIGGLAKDADNIATAGSPYIAGLESGGPILIDVTALWKHPLFSEAH